MQWTNKMQHQNIRIPLTSILTVRWGYDDNTAKTLLYSVSLKVFRSFLQIHRNILPHGIPHHHLQDAPNWRDKTSLQRTSSVEACMPTHLNCMKRFSGESSYSVNYLDCVAKPFSSHPNIMVIWLSWTNNYYMWVKCFFYGRVNYF